jgi:hypothetical protein
MKIDVKILENNEVQTVEKNISNFQIHTETDAGVSFSARILDNGKDAPPHVGLVNFNNVTSKLLKNTLSLLYQVVGLLYEEKVLRSKHGWQIGMIETLEKELLSINKEIEEHENLLEAATIRVDCACNIPEATDKTKEELSDLRKIFEDRKVYLDDMKQQYTDNQSPELKTKYLAELQDMRNLVKKINELVEYVNYKYVYKLNNIIEVDRYNFFINQLKNKKGLLLDRLRLIRDNQSTKQDEMIYISKRLELEEDHEL